MTKCSHCGAELAPGSKFCTACGTTVSETAQQSGSPLVYPQNNNPQPLAGAAVPRPTPLPNQQPMSPPTDYQQVQENLPSGYMSVKSFVWHSILFALPVIGWLICIGFAFMSKNSVKKNFARATLVLLAIGLVLSLILGSIGYWYAELIIANLQNYVR